MTESKLQMTPAEAAKVIEHHFYYKKLCGESLDFGKLLPHEQAVVVLYRAWKEKARELDPAEGE